MGQNDSGSGARVKLCAGIVSFCRAQYNRTHRRACRPHDGAVGRLTGASVAAILIVEDSPDNMKLFRTLLTLKGHEITGIIGGDELFATLERMTPALVLMDIQMPGKDGYTLVGEIRASEHRALRVIALTANAMAGDMEKALDAGFDGYISKPIDIRKFPDQVARALLGKNPLDG
jgi:two-component system cell cycle response regulator DivK